MTATAATVLTYGLIAGLFLAVAISLAAGGLATPQRWTAALLMLGAAAHTIDNIGFELAGRHHAIWLAWVLSCAATGFFWAFVQASFDDRPLPPWVRLVPATVLLGTLMLAHVSPAVVAPGIFVAFTLIVAGLMVHAGWLLVIGWRGDLVEGRRRLRLPMLAGTVVYILMVQAFDLAGLAGVQVGDLSMLQAIVLGVLAVGAVLVLLQPDSVLLAAQAHPTAGTPRDRPAATVAAIDPADRALAQRLAIAMDKDEIWRREDLSIGALAQHLRAPEHRLRHLINSQLGYRNFAAFLNARRIAAAQALLADPENGRRPVSAIAFELGYASLGPFNRAFKEATGKTPTQWRAEALTRDPPAAAVG